MRNTSPERNYSSKRWLYTKNSLHEFDPRLTKNDLNRSKAIRKIEKREEKQRKSASSHKN